MHNAQSLVVPAAAERIRLKQSRLLAESYHQDLDLTGAIRVETARILPKATTPPLNALL